MVYVVTEMESFIRDRGWIDVFGKRIIMQTPEAMSLFPPGLKGRFSWLMLFEDGSRIDLTILPVKDLDVYLHEDTLTRILMDKDGRIGTQEPLPEPDDRDYWVTKPSPEFFDDCCNEFWWVSTYVVKGLCRGELLYAAEHLNLIVRKELLRMLSWRAGLDHGFSFSPGKSYKYLEKYLPVETFTRLLKTCRLDGGEHIRESLLESLALFREASGYTAEKLGFTYPAYDQKVSAYINGKLTPRK